MEKRETEPPSFGNAERLAEVLKEGEGRFERLVEGLPVGVLIHDPRAEILFANPAAAEMLGLPMAALLGKTSMDAGQFALHEDGSPFPGEDHPAPVALATGRPVRNVVVGFRRPARADVAWLLVSADPQLGPGGSVARVVSTFIDISPHRQATEKLRESETRYRQLVETAHDLIYRTDADGYFTYVNPVATRVLGYAPEELAGKHYLEMIRPDHRARVQAHLRRQYWQRSASSYDEFVMLARAAVAGFLRRGRGGGGVDPERRRPREGARGGAGGGAREVRVRHERQPRAPHPAERRDRHDGPPARHAARRHPEGLRPYDRA